MPRYFFDVVENGKRHCDEDGQVYADLGVASSEATHSLYEVAHHLTDAAKSYQLVIQVREGAGPPVLEASLSFQVRRVP